MPFYPLSSALCRHPRLGHLFCVGLLPENGCNFSPDEGGSEATSQVERSRWAEGDRLPAAGWATRRLGRLEGAPPPPYNSRSQLGDAPKPSMQDVHDLTQNGFSRTYLKWPKATVCCNSPGVYQPCGGGPCGCQSQVRHRPSLLVPAQPGWNEADQDPHHPARRGCGCHSGLVHAVFHGGSAGALRGDCAPGDGRGHDGQQSPPTS